MNGKYLESIVLATDKAAKDQYGADNDSFDVRIDALIEALFLLATLKTAETEEPSNMPPGESANSFKVKVRALL